MAKEQRKIHKTKKCLKPKCQPKKQSTNHYRCGNLKFKFKERSLSLPLEHDSILTLQFIRMLLAFKTTYIWTASKDCGSKTVCMCRACTQCSYSRPSLSSGMLALTLPSRFVLPLSPPYTYICVHCVLFCLFRAHSCVFDVLRAFSVSLFSNSSRIFLCSALACKFLQVFNDTNKEYNKNRVKKELCHFK